MREIKFRVFTKKGFEFFDLPRLYWRGEETGDYSFPEGKNVQQYTGLKDKNGKEIYEGDIVDFGKTFYHPKAEVVSWPDGAAGFSPFVDADEAEGQAIFPSGGQCEVIGNVYESPELVPK